MKTLLWAAAASLSLLAPAMAQDHSHHQHHNQHPQAAEPMAEHSVYQLQGQWTTQLGQSLALRDLKGQPAIVTLFYGSCTTACPVLVNDVKRLYQLLDPQLQQQVRLVMVSLDSERDTPAVMRAYTEHYGLDNDRWLFLHGNDADIRGLATVLGVRYRKRDDGNFDHSNLVTVLDREGRVSFRVEGLAQPMEKAAAHVNAL